jgi:hypothetical protein
MTGWWTGSLTARRSPIVLTRVAPRSDTVGRPVGREYGLSDGGRIDRPDDPRQSAELESGGTRLSGSSDAHPHRIGHHGEMVTIGFLRPDGLRRVGMTVDGIILRDDAPDGLDDDGGQSPHARSHPHRQERRSVGERWPLG